MKSNKNKSAVRKNQVRIIAGQYRSQLINVLSHEGLRPSTDRVRETVFNWMGHQWGGRFNGKRVLDAFAGSGAFGLECVSRGVDQVLMIDNYAPTIDSIKSTLACWEVCEGVQALCCDVFDWLKQPYKNVVAFDWVILDPPFAHEMLLKIVPLLKDITHEQSWLYVEAELSVNLDVLLEQGWVVVREGKTAQVQYGLWQRA